MHQKIKLQEDYQTARRVALLAYANWSCAVFGFWGATTNEVGAVEATVFVGFMMKKQICGRHASRRHAHQVGLLHPQFANTIKFLTLKREENKRDVFQNEIGDAESDVQRENQEAKARRKVMCRCLRDPQNECMIGYPQINRERQQRLYIHDASA